MHSQGRAVVVTR